MGWKLGGGLIVTPVGTARRTLLEARGVSAGPAAQPVLHDLDLGLREGEIVLLAGPNGAGKSTALRALAGDLPPHSGTVDWLRRPAPRGAHRRAARGLSYLPSSGSLAPRLRVRSNLRLGGSRPEVAVALVPEVEALLRRRAAKLSVDERQLVTLARALGGRPKALLVDELSAGVSPGVVDRMLEALRQAADRGLGVLLVEQHVRKALAVVDRVVVLRHGRVEFAGTADEAQRDIAELEAGYLVV